MQVDYAILADAATTESGKHYIHGGGWDTLFAPSFPAVHPVMAVALRLRVPWADTNIEHHIGLDVLDSDGNSVLTDAGPSGDITVGRPPQLALGTDQTVPLAFTLLNIAFPAAGDYALVVRIDKVDATRSPFRLVAIPQA